MSRIFVVALVFLAQSAFAVEPVPKAETKEKVESIRDGGGALKVEQTPAMSAEELQSGPAEKTAEPASPTAPHLFGVHGSIGVPHPINFGLNYVMPNRMFSFELSTGSFGVKVSDVDIKMNNTELGLRYHPFFGSFFIGALVGNQKISGKKSERITDTGTSISYDVTAEVEVKSNYVTPQLGWMWGGGSSGFFAMIEIGLQKPSGVSSTFSSDAPGVVQDQAEYAKLKKDVEDGGDNIGNTTLPHLALLKFGWLF